MKKITISLSDEVYRQARIQAAKRGTTVNVLVMEFLRSFGKDTDFYRRKRLQAEVLASIGPFRGGDRLIRDDANDRDLVR